MVYAVTATKYWPALASFVKNINQLDIITVHATVLLYEVVL